MENKDFSEEELKRLVDISRPGYILTEREAENGYVGGLIGFPPTYNLYKEYKQNIDFDIEKFERDLLEVLNNVN